MKEEENKKGEEKKRGGGELEQEKKKKQKEKGRRRRRREHAKANSQVLLYKLKARPAERLVTGVFKHLVGERHDGLAWNILKT